MRDSETDPSEITVTYPAGKHTFTRTQEGEWALDLSGPPELGTMPRVGPYDDAGVLRVLTAFLTKAAPADTVASIPADSVPPDIRNGWL